MATLRKVAAVGLAIVVITAPAAVGKPRKPPKTTRTETAEYTGGTGVSGPAAVSLCAGVNGCLSFAAQPGEEYVGIEITDSTGTPAPFQVSIDGISTVHCGETETPVWLVDATEIAVSVLGASADCSGVGTSGSVSATFSNRL